MSRIQRKPYNERCGGITVVLLVLAAIGTVTTRSAEADGPQQPIKGSVEHSHQAETHLEGNTATTAERLNDMRDSYKKLERMTLLLINETQRRECSTPRSPNFVGGTLIPGTPSIEMGKLPPRDRMVRILLTEINASVRKLQLDERAIDASVVNSDNETLKKEWKLVVGTTGDIIDHYRELEEAAMAPPYQLKVINKCSLRIFEDTHGIDRFWQPIRKAINSGN